MACSRLGSLVLVTPLRCIGFQREGRGEMGEGRGEPGQDRRTGADDRRKKKKRKEAREVRPITSLLQNPIYPPRKCLSVSAPAIGVLRRSNRATQGTQGRPSRSRAKASLDQHRVQYPCTYPSCTFRVHTPTNTPLQAPQPRERTRIDGLHMTCVCSSSPLIPGQLCVDQIPSVQGSGHLLLVWCGQGSAEGVGQASERA